VVEILGFPLYYPLALPTATSNHSALYHRSLGLDDESLINILFGDKEHFIIIISYLQKNGRVINNAFGHLCLIGAFLLVGGTSNRGPAALVSVVKELHYDWTPIPLVVAETILCLD